MGTLNDQHFYAVRASGAELRLPFTPRPFTALVDIAEDLDETVLQSYATTLVKHGCVQAVCRGGGAERLADIFDGLAEHSEFDKNDIPFTSMCVDEDEPLQEAIQYFVLPCGLAATGLLMIIGGSGDFQDAVQDFSAAAGTMQEDVGTPVYAEEDMVCFVTR